ncbi:hypothetical protein [Pseudodesulfovibrio sp.]|uniref:hypothetical protein n=1 Tax=Pseudodesulfovibrio sp. TaxID=2035812 RepID=UPI0026289D7F|nr:hypothetical protein [Pseudodesulfovibrio sp.]MDD3313727.1 hypothetical protein [Pseudodesulfovibrio sp.]
MLHTPVSVPLRIRLPALLLALLLAGCNVVGASVGAGASSGAGVVFSAYNDFLYTGPGAAYANNKKGLERFLAKDYAGAGDIFATTLSSYPANPDAVYYFGLCRIYLGARDEGFARLASYDDPNNFRITQEVRWWANYCAKKPELTPEKIRQVMNKARGEGYRRQIQEDWDDRLMGW